MAPTKSRKAATSDIPVGTQFSPNLVDLKAFLASIVTHSGDKAAMQAAVWNPPVRTTPATGTPTRRRGSLPLEAARQYGLLDETYSATDLSRRLAALEDPNLSDEFARHILLRLRGLRVVEAVLEMTRDGLRITGDSLAEYLTNQGVRVTIHNTAINSMRMWLDRAGVFAEKSWAVDVARLEALIGLSRPEIAALTGLNEEQQAFLLALCRINPSGEYPAG